MAVNQQNFVKIEAKLAKVRRIVIASEAQPSAAISLLPLLPQG